nr:PREDICTED: ribonuclease inhibitor-like isoform X2 [Latimeria chalumnae]|eukprot:XP_014351023.1 PREDICTED: ribonuclease inhibitor-like isoform X2 [Latimeria chalumnae]
MQHMGTSRKNGKKAKQGRYALVCCMRDLTVHIILSLQGPPVRVCQCLMLGIDVKVEQAADPMQSDESSQSGRCPNQEDVTFHNVLHTEGLQMTLCRKGWIFFILMNLLKWQRSSSATLTVLCQNPIVRASFGEDIILQCQLDPPIDATNMEVRWFRTVNFDIVHLYRNNKDDYRMQNIAYRGRTELSKEDLVTGTISLYLRNVGFTDEGKFICFVVSEREAEESQIEVKVGGFNEPELELLDYELSGFYYAIRLLCKTEGWYPKPEIHWTNENGENLTTLSKSTIEQNDEGFFTVESHINVMKGSENFFSCVLKNSFPTTAKTSIRIPDAAFPPVSTQLLVSLFRILCFVIPLSAVGIFFHKVLQEHAFFHEHCERMEFYINGKTTVNWSLKNISPLLHMCKKISLNRCELTAGCFEVLHSLLHTSQTLRELDLSYSKLGDPELRFFSNGLNDTNSTVQTLHLNNCYLTSDSCEALSSFLSRNHSLTELNLSNNPIKDAGMSLICNVINNQIQKLSLNSCSFTSGCCEVLSSFMRRNQSLADLNLSFNQIQDSGMSLICQADNDQIQNLSLNSCSLTSGCCEALCSFLKQNQSLRELDLTSNKIEDSGMSEICKADNNHLQKLSLNSCSLTSGCCEALCSFLKQNQSLRELDLTSNKIEDSGLSEICKADNNQLQKLNLMWCHLTAGCCKDLTSVLHTNQTLTELNLEGNTLRDSGVREICAALKDPNCKLQTLNLRCCDLTAGCCNDLASVLHTNQTLTELNLRYNTLGDSGVREICAALKEPNCKLQTLKLHDNSLSYNMKEELKEIERSKPGLKIEF